MAGRPVGARAGQEAREFDPRREARRQLLRVSVPEGVDPRELDQEVRSDLRSLAKDTAELAAQHLIMTGRLIDDDPVQALAHARAATALAGRVAAVREAAGLAAYAAQEWALAVAELRTARRISGRPDHLAVLADCERALGRPERALSVLDDPDVKHLDQAARVELVIVVAGARRDLGELDAAVLLLQVPAQGTKARHPWAARLWYAYADALQAAGRAEARDWFERAAEIDEGETEALDRLLELDGVVFAAGAEDEADDEDEAEGGPSVSLEELGLHPVTSAEAPVRGGVDDTRRDAVEAVDDRGEEPAVLRDEVPVRSQAVDGADAPHGADRHAAADASSAAAEATEPEAPPAAAQSRQIDVVPEMGASGVAPPVFSHDEEPAPKPPVVGLPGQQDLFSDLED